MGNLQESIEDFFDAYQDRFNTALNGGPTDVKGTVDSFADCFVEASPVGVNCGKNNFFFRWGIARGYSFYKKIGTVSMIILSKEITSLNDLHTMVRVNWRSTNIRKEDQKEIVIDFSVIYFVQHLDGKLKIFAYITGDEQRVLKEHGLI